MAIDITTSAGGIRYPTDPRDRLVVSFVEFSTDPSSNYIDLGPENATDRFYATNLGFLAQVEHIRDLRQRRPDRIVTAGFTYSEVERIINIGGDAVVQLPQEMPKPEMKLPEGDVWPCFDWLINEGDNWDPSYIDASVEVDGEVAGIKIGRQPWANLWGVWLLDDDHNGRIVSVHRWGDRDSAIAAAEQLAAEQKTGQVVVDLYVLADLLTIAEPKPSIPKTQE